MINYKLKINYLPGGTVTDVGKNKVANLEKSFHLLCEKEKRRENKVSGERALK